LVEFRNDVDFGLCGAQNGRVAACCDAGETTVLSIASDNKPATQYQALCMAINVFLHVKATN
jgi:hypothetical protein